MNLGLQLGLELKQKKKLKLDEILKQDLRLEIAQKLKPFDFWEWYTGSPEDLIRLLKEEPQTDDYGKTIKYVLSGGWAIEMLTGKKREHHDLDVINLSRYKFQFRLDEQTAKNYFQTLSMSNKNLAKFVKEINWDSEKNYSELKGGSLDVYITSPEFLFASKILGFGRTPREKDLEDLQSLAKLDYKYSASRFQELLTKVPFIKHSLDNSKLFYDIAGINGFGTRTAGAEYLVKIIDKLRNGKNIAIDEMKTFYHIVQKNFEDGLQKNIIASKENLDLGVISDYWSKGDLEGFWFENNEKPDFAISKVSKNMLKEIQKRTNYKEKMSDWPIGEIINYAGFDIVHSDPMHFFFKDGEVFNRFSNYTLDNVKGEEFIIASNTTSTQLFNNGKHLLTLFRSMEDKENVSSIYTSFMEYGSPEEFFELHDTLKHVDFSDNWYFAELFENKVAEYVLKDSSVAKKFAQIGNVDLDNIVYKKRSNSNITNINKLDNLYLLPEHLLDSSNNLVARRLIKLAPKSAKKFAESQNMDIKKIVEMRYQDIKNDAALSYVLCKDVPEFFSEQLKESIAVYHCVESAKRHPKNILQRLQKIASGINVDSAKLIRETVNSDVPTEIKAKLLIEGKEYFGKDVAVSYLSDLLEMNYDNKKWSDLASEYISEFNLQKETEFQFKLHPKYASLTDVVKNTNIDGRYLSDLANIYLEDNISSLNNDQIKEIMSTYAIDDVSSIVFNDWEKKIELGNDAGLRKTYETRLKGDVVKQEKVSEFATNLSNKYFEEGDFKKSFYVLYRIDRENPLISERAIEYFKTVPEKNKKIVLANVVGEFIK
ncbi:hypothetical protein K9L97_03725 [Candidatus Woesearchaeota archaeon]|nr:hypothetical protein [Candidatus Woesearchaeota archaeon]